MRCRWGVLALAWAALACAVPVAGCGGGASRRAPTGPAREALPLPEGPVEVAYRPPPGGSRYRIQLDYAGSTLVTPKRFDLEEQRFHESYDLELQYLERPTQAASPEERAAVLILEALRQDQLSSPPGTKRLLELANDRLRIQSDGETQIDLRGKQRARASKLTARSLLDRTFGFVRTEPLGSPISIVVRGRPEARGVLGMVPLRHALLYTRIALPTAEVGPGAVWQRRRTPLSPAGRFGLALDVEHRFLGYEKIDGVSCARVMIRGSQKGQKVETLSGAILDEVEAEIHGEAWLDLATGEPYRLRLSDDLAIEVETEEDGIGRTAGTYRYRFSGHASLERLDGEVDSEVWADGTERFSGQ